MTLALIALMVFLVAWLYDSGKKAEDKKDYRARTITNVKRQDELWCENFTKIMSDLEAIDRVKKIDGDSIMQTIESLFAKYDVPDTRTNGEKLSALQRHLRLYKEGYKNTLSNYKIDCIIARASKEPEPPEPKCDLYSSIWYYPWKLPHVDKPEFFFGERETYITIDGIEYKYNEYGRASNFFGTEPSKLINQICILLTKRDLDKEKLNYSWNRRESDWQETDREVKEYEEKKKKYPWLYK